MHVCSCARTCVSACLCSCTCISVCPCVQGVDKSPSTRTRPHTACLSLSFSHSDPQSVFSTFPLSTSVAPCSDCCTPVSIVLSISCLCSISPNVTRLQPPPPASACAKGPLTPLVLTPAPSARLPGHHSPGPPPWPPQALRCKGLPLGGATSFTLTVHGQTSKQRTLPHPLGSTPHAGHLLPIKT